MEIEREKSGGHLVVKLRGQLDATWSPVVEKALSTAIREGEHRIRVDLSGVDYVSSAGLRVVMSAYKQLKAIGGLFAVANPSPQVVKILDLSGLTGLLSAAPATAPEAASAREFESAHASWQVFQDAPAERVTLRRVGGATPWEGAAGELAAFPDGAFGLGVGALATSRDEAASRLGEVLAAAGCAAHLPAGEGTRPDFLISERDLVPQVWMTSGLAGKGDLSCFLRFDVRPEERSVGLREVVQACADAVGAKEAAIVMIAETAVLVGASLHRSPAVGAAVADPFAFPNVRDWLSFTSERAFRDTTSLVVGVAAAAGSAWGTHLRPLGRSGDWMGHFHAASFPYRPVRKGRLLQKEAVAGLFEGEGLQALLHLLNDTRDPDGCGESEFFRGACWVAPLQP